MCFLIPCPGPTIYWAEGIISWAVHEDCPILVISASPLPTIRSNHARSPHWILIVHLTVRNQRSVTSPSIGNFQYIYKAAPFESFRSPFFFFWLEFLFWSLEIRVLVKNGIGGKWREEGRRWDRARRRRRSKGVARPASSSPWVILPGSSRLAITLSALVPELLSTSLPSLNT